MKGKKKKNNNKKKGGEGRRIKKKSPVPKLRMGVTINVVFDKFKITSLKFK